MAAVLTKDWHSCQTSLYPVKLINIKSCITKCYSLKGELGFEGQILEMSFRTSSEPRFGSKPRHKHLWTVLVTVSRSDIVTSNTAFWHQNTTLKFPLPSKWDSISPLSSRSHFHDVVPVTDAQIISNSAGKGVFCLISMQRANLLKDWEADCILSSR